MFLKKSSDDRHEFKPLLVEIEERPLNPLGRSIFWIVIAAITFASVWMFVGEVDVVVTARGKVIPTGEVKVIQPLNSGVVTGILIEPGDYVSKGQLLMEIDPSDVDPELESMHEDHKQVTLEVIRINALLKERPFDFFDQDYDAEMLRVQRDIYDSEKERLRKQVQVKLGVLAQHQERLEAENKALGQASYMSDLLKVKMGRLQAVKDIISRDEYEQTESELKKYQTEFQASNHRIAEILALKEQTNQEIAYIKEEQRTRLLAELAEKKQRYLYLQAKIERSEFISTRQQITAPVDGYVSQLLFHTIGGVVTPAEKLAFIVPTNSPLLIKSFLLNKDAGFVASGMDASIKIDTFNFQKYGTIDGEVIQVSKDSIEDEQLGLVYETYIAPQSKTLMVNGVETPISAGMSVTSEVKVGKRRIIEFFLYPLIKYLDEGVSVM